MARSPGFGSIPCNLFAQLRLGFPTAPYTVNLATEYKSLTHYTKVRSHPIPLLYGQFISAGFSSTVRFTIAILSHCEHWPRHFDGAPLLVRTRFQVLFHSLAGVLFAFPSRYWFTIGQSGVFSLGGWSPYSDRITRVPPYSSSSQH